MRLTLKDNFLKAIDNKIVSSDSIVRMKVDKDVICIGVLEFFNGAKKIIEFVKESEESEYKIGRLIIDEADIEYLSSVRFYIQSINGSLKTNSNVIQIKFDTSLIKTDIKRNISNQYKDVIEQLKLLEEKVNILTTGKILTKINILNRDAIKPGMIPVAVDNEANFVALYPFSNHIVEVNGQRAANGAVLIDATMIKYKKNKKTIEEALDDQANAIVSMNELINTLIDSAKEIRNKVDELDMRLSQHINNGII